MIKNGPLIVIIVLCFATFHSRMVSIPPALPGIFFHRSIFTKLFLILYKDTEIAIIFSCEILPLKLAKAVISILMYFPSFKLLKSNQEAERDPLDEVSDFGE